MRFKIGFRVDWSTLMHFLGHTGYVWLLALVAGFDPQEAALSSLVLGLVVEIGQGLSEHAPSFFDIADEIANLLGAATVLII